MNRDRYIRTWLTALAVILALAGKAPVVHADGVNLSANFDTIDTESDQENRITGETSETSSSVRRQRYFLNFSRHFYPYLVFSGGGNFGLEETESDFDGGTTNSEKTTIRPYLELKLVSPTFQTGLGYQDSEIRRRVDGGARTTQSLTTYYTFFSLEPEDLPDLDVRYARTERSSDPETTDRLEELTTVNTSYLFDGGIVDYTFTLNESDDRLGDFRTKTTGHSGKIQYARSHLDGRVSIDTGYWFSQSETDLDGAGSALIPQLRSAGLFSLDLTPEDGPALEPIGGLIDGNLEAPTSLDLGLAGDETTLINIGLDLGFPTNVDTIYLWVDRELTPEVSDSFTWSIYTSDDNTDDSEWELLTTISPGTFDSFENRFELTFPEVNTRYIKITVTPLLASVPGSGAFNNIFVTEMEIFSTITSEDGFSTMSHNLNYNIGWKATERTSLGYDWFYRYRKTDPADAEVSSMTNGAFINHIFSDIFSGSMRASRQDRDEPGGLSSTVNYSAALRANYIKTFRQTLTYSSTRSRSDLEDNKTDGVFLRNNADLYRGVSVYLDTGLSWAKVQDEPDTRSTLLRVGSRLEPNDVVTVNLDYTANRSHVSGGDTRLKETGSFQTFVLPSRYLSLFARLRYDEDDEIRTTSQNYSLNWAPVSGGSLQFFLSYDQRILSENNQEEEVLSPGLRWRITRYASLRTTYSLFTKDSDTEKLDSRSLTANLKINL
ncbi:MAG: hypothetical protein PVJ01_01010 [Pseudomonadota bacterium]